MSYIILHSLILSQLYIPILCLLEVALDLRVENLLVWCTDENILQVNLCLLVLWNVLLVLCAIRCNYMRRYSLCALSKDILLHLILFLILYVTIVTDILHLFLNCLLLNLRYLCLLELLKVIIIWLRAAILLFLIFLDNWLELCLTIVIILLLVFYLDFIYDSIFVLFWFICTLVEGQSDAGLEQFTFSVELLLDDLMVRQNLPWWICRFANSKLLT